MLLSDWWRFVPTDVTEGRCATLSSVPSSSARLLILNSLCIGPTTLFTCDKVSTINACHWSEMADGALTVRCNGLRLTEVPVGLTNRTTRLFLNKNSISSLPADSFSDLFLLDELDLSHNQVSFLEVGCFNGLLSFLRFLNLSSNRLSTLDPALFDGLQLLMPQLDRDPPIWLNSSVRPPTSRTSVHFLYTSLDLTYCAVGAVGLPMLLLMEDWDLCRSVRRTHDVLTLVTVFLWFFMLISYLAYYIRERGCRSLTLGVPEVPGEPGSSL